MLHHLIENWKEEWERKSGKTHNLPFYFVQIPTQLHTSPRDDYRISYNILRESMRKYFVTKDRKNFFGMAIAYDTGPDEHPIDVEPIGKRLAYYVLNKLYKYKDVYPNGPILFRATYRGGKAVLTFMYRGQEGLRNEHGEIGDVNFFEIAGEDKVYYPAHAYINEAGTRVIVESEQVTNPKHVRYLYRVTQEEVSAEVSLYNSEGLPASPFIDDPSLVLLPSVDDPSLVLSRSIDDTINEMFTDTQPTENKNAIDSNMVVYPNPSIGYVKLTIPEAFDVSNTSVRIVTIFGGLPVKTFSYNASGTYDVSDLSTGFYSIIVSDGKNSITKKLLKK